MRMLMASLLAFSMAGSALAGPGKKKDLPKFEDISSGFEQVVSTADGQQPLLGLWIDRKNNQLLAELPRGYEKQRHYIAMTQASGSLFAGLQGPARYVYWKRYGNRMAIIQPELQTRSTVSESESSVKRLFTDRVLADVNILAHGPNGQPVIDLDDLLVKQLDMSGRRGRSGGAVNSRLLRVVKAKAFPENCEVALEVPVASRLSSFHFSISLLKQDPTYKPRVSDERVGYFNTVFRDLGQYNQDKKMVRYIDRWHLQKSDPSLKMSPPKEPIVFYLEHTIPVRYRRWVRQGVDYWNDAFRAVGLEGAIEVRYQDMATNTHMDKDPEDVRYNFVRWLNNDISTAIGPHRAHPLTGQILDADIVLTDGWIRAYHRWQMQLPELATQSFSPETLTWLEDHPQWDPRLLLIPEERREHVLQQRAARAAGEAMPLPDDPILAEQAELAAIGEWVGRDHQCLAAHGLALDMAMANMHLQMMDPDFFDSIETDGKDDILDGIPEWFVGPLLAELVCHEVGHTLGLRHNFKASSIYTMEEINSDEVKGKKPLAGSVMDYLPPNINMETGEIQGDFTMITVGPYDMWAIEYGYTFDDPKKVLERVADPELVFLTDDDTTGPDPLARRYDFSKDPLTYGENQMRLAMHHRERILDAFVKDGQSWSKAREGYLMTLGLQTRVLGMMANWVGGAHVNRDRKGDPNGRPPIEVVDPAKQRHAMEFVIDHAFNDEAYGLTPELLTHMTIDKWSDLGRVSSSTWNVHNQIAGVQSSALTMVLNPQTLTWVYDNELRTPTEEDALTLPELMSAFTDAIYSELSTDLNGATFTDRQPMISSLRRNLQSSMTDRLIFLTSGDERLPRPIRTLALKHLRDLGGQLEKVLKKSEAGQVDAYTVAHLQDISTRVEKALNAIYVSEM